MEVKFGTDGVRGPREVVSNDVAWQIGAAAAQLLGKKCVVVSDTRGFNPELVEAFSSGVSSEGGRVTDLGILPTPACALTASALMQKEDEPYWATSFSASHNPSEDAGIKVFGIGGRKLNEAATKELQTLASSISPAKNIKTSIRLTSQNTYDVLRENYINMVISSLHPDLRSSNFLSGRKIAVDAANGAAFWTAPEILGRLGAKVMMINDDPKHPINENCGAEHAYEHPNYLQGILKASKASIVLALDGDADRLIGAIEDRTIDGDDAVILAAKNLIHQNLLKNKYVATTAYSNLGLDDHLKNLGIKVVEVENGDRFVLDAMEAHDLQIGGEFSGHTLYREAAKRMGLVMSGDGVLSALQMFEAEAITGQNIAELSNWLRLPHRLVNIKLNHAVNAESLLKHPDIVAAIESNRAQLGSEGRILVRASGTQPIIRILGKAHDEVELDVVIANLSRSFTETI